MRNSLVVEYRVLLEHSNNTLTDLITNRLDYTIELSLLRNFTRWPRPHPPLVLLLSSPSRDRTKPPAGPISSASMVLLQKLLLLTAADSSALVLTAATAHALAAG